MCHVLLELPPHRGEPHQLSPGVLRELSRARTTEDRL